MHFFEEKDITYQKGKLLKIITRKRQRTSRVPKVIKSRLKKEIYKLIVCGLVYFTVSLSEETCREPIRSNCISQRQVCTFYSDFELTDS